MVTSILPLLLPLVVRSLTLVVNKESTGTDISGNDKSNDINGNKSTDISSTKSTATSGTKSTDISGNNESTGISGKDESTSTPTSGSKSAATSGNKSTDISGNVQLISNAGHIPGGTITNNICSEPMQGEQR